MRKVTVIAFTLVAGLSLAWSAQADDAAKDAGARPDSSKELFTRLDANGDGQISSDEIPEAKKQLLDRLLRTADANKDGKLSAEEFAAGTKSQRPKRELEKKQPAEQPGAEVVRRVIRQLDTNSDGQIVADEVSPQYREMFTKLLGVADADKDGKIDRRELIRSAPKINTLLAQARKKGQQNPAQMFERLDANKDGKVVLDEVPEGRREMFKRLMDRADKDKDGALTKDELTAAVKSFQRPANAQRPQLPAGGLFAALDKNKDGEISADEISAASASLTKLDKNSDGKITRNELFQRGARPQGAAGFRANPEQMLKRFLAMDKNKDGKISKDEAPERFRPQFDRVDSNSDGHLDEGEIKKLVQRITGKSGAKSDK